MFAARTGRGVDWRTWGRCQHLWDRCRGVGLLDIEFDSASLQLCREAVGLALRRQMSKVRQDRAGQWRESLSHVADPRSVKAFRFIKQGDCAQFHFVQREDGSATGAGRDYPQALG
eukprot:4307331-Amphidinium_carterae.2